MTHAYRKLRSRAVLVRRVCDNWMLQARVAFARTRYQVPGSDPSIPLGGELVPHLFFAHCEAIYAFKIVFMIP